MRDYSKISGRFWTGKTGKALRGNLEMQVLAMYLMTSPHSNMIGVYHCPVMYMAHETGLSIEGAKKALESLIKAGFCTFDGEEEVIWVHEMAAHQIGEELHPKDKQIVGIRKQYAQIVCAEIRRGFAVRYEVCFHLDLPEGDEWPCEGASMPGTGTGTGTGEKKGANKVRFSTWLEDIKAKSEKAISDYKPVFEYADKVSLPVEFVQLAWFEFGRQFGAGGVNEAKLQVDWRKTFRNYVEKNYLKLWWLKPEGGYELTTLGRQAEKANAERIAA